MDVPALIAIAAGLAAILSFAYVVFVGVRQWLLRAD
jgi:hypothetical protein